MPGTDGTGPLGYGPMTGRKMGYCAGGYGDRQGFTGFGRRPGLGRGGFFRRGFGRGRGFFAGYDPDFDRQSNAEYLKNEAEYLRNALKGIEKRLAEMEAGKNAE